jgi:hypothetical protein
MKNKKITLHSIGNQGNFNFYVFDKRQEVFDVLDKILIMDFGIDLKLPYVDYSRKIKKINVKKYTDVHFSSGNEFFRIDIFYGNKKMFVTIHCSEKLRLKFNEALFKYSTMPKPKKIKIKIFRKRRK